MLQQRVCLLLDRDYRVEKAIPRRWKLASACLGTAGSPPALDGNAAGVGRDGRR